MRLEGVIDKSELIAIASFVLSIAVILVVVVQH